MGSPKKGHERFVVLDREDQFLGAFWAASAVAAIQQAIAAGYDAWSVRSVAVG